MVRAKLYLMCGLPYSGKSTLAREIAQHTGAVLVCQDDTWFEKMKEWGLDEHSDEHWERVLKISYEKVNQLLEDGHSVVFDDAALTHKKREQLRLLAAAHGAESILIYLDTPLQTRQERKSRNLITHERHDVPDSIVAWAEAELQIPGADERPVIYQPGLSVTDWLRELP